MEKVYIDAYLFKNLGDDLFIKILLDRYKYVEFYAATRDYYPKTVFNKNLKIYSNIFVGLINKFFEIVFKKYNFIGRRLKNKADYMVSIGGSIFMEKNNFSTVERQFALYNSDKPLFILGSNFGPYKTEKYKEFIKQNVLSNAKDVCFRDKYSYDNFSELDNVRYNSDIVFNLDVNNLDIKENKNVVISVIDCNLKKLSKEKEKYERLLKSLISKFIKSDYTVTLMSFCKIQGDEEVINSLYSQCTDEEKKHISKFFYDGNINEALKEIAQSQIVVGSRFHANILGILMNKKILPVAYSDKTINVLKDMKYDGEIIDIRKIDEYDIEDFSINIDDYKIDIETLIQSANNQFKELDKLLGGQK